MQCNIQLSWCKCQIKLLICQFLKETHAHFFCNFWSCPQKRLSLARAVTSNLAFPWLGERPPPWKDLEDLEERQRRCLDLTTNLFKGRGTIHNGPLFIQIQIENLIFHRWKVVKGIWLVLPRWPARVGSLRSADDDRGSLGPWVVLPGQFKPRSHLLQPLHKQSVGRWTPEVSDVVEESKLWRREKSETHFGFPKPYLGFWVDMSVSPPSASPLERVQTTRARFVRAKPDPVLRSWQDSTSIKSVWLFRTNKRES